MKHEQLTFVQKLAVTLVFIGVCAGGYTGWRWASQVTVHEVAMTGLVNVAEDEIREIIRVDTGMVMYDINTVVLEDRIARHPWVSAVNVSRIPSGRLRIRILERTPVAVLMGSGGRPSTWVDRTGQRMPMTGRATYDVPLITANIGIYHPMQRIEHESTLELLDTISRLPSNMDAMISEFIRTNEGWDLRLSPAGSGTSIPVRLGHDDFEDKFRQLKAFWDAEVLQHQNKHFELIDLRFDSQIVVRERLR